MGLLKSIEIFRHISIYHTGVGSNNISFLPSLGFFIRIDWKFHRENKNLTGTARYASVNTHLGIGENCFYVTHFISIIICER